MADNEGKNDIPRRKRGRDRGGGRAPARGRPSARGRGKQPAQVRRFHESDSEEEEDVTVIVQGPAPDGTIPAPDGTIFLSTNPEHHLKRYPEKSRGDGTNRRISHDCRGCKNSIDIGGTRLKISRHTSYYCTACRVCFHPECFAKWHYENSPSYVFAKQDTNIPGDLIVM